MSITVGNLTLADRALLAPMSGVTDFPFRSILRSLGADVTISEMTASRAILRGEREECRKLDQLDDRTIVQIAGHEPDAMAEAARYCEARGAIMVDINFGCPAKKVVNRYAGSALMRDEELAGDILKQVGKAVGIPVSLKMRTGWDHENRNAVTIAKIAEDCGFSLLTVHGRTRAQKFTGKADWRFIQNVKNAVSVPVIANGDIESVDDVRECLRQSGADGVMIGRSAVGRPWLIPEINRALSDDATEFQFSLREKIDTVRAHYLGMIANSPGRRGVLTARKHLSAYFAVLPCAKEQLHDVLRTEDAELVIDRLDQYAEEWGQAA
ncbi:MAG: tRNA dihydrouridine synthase DusB [Rhodospirillaceae bacterium]|nr:tRNA dihydrouridine synthase DusB [Rhodospirillaceae bacterium]